MSLMKILFVDDEEQILAALKRMLRRYHHEWDMHFVNSGAAALTLLEEGSFDLVVSDVQMPVMDGITLLEEIQRQYPDIVRFILSGHSGKVDTLRSTGIAHQYMAKPCDADTLRETVAKSSALHQELNNPDLVAAIAGTTNLPSAPTLYHQILRELKSDGPSLAHVGAIVARDPAMSAKILQLVNSAFFATRRSITDIKQAVSLLGTETIIALVLTAHLFRRADAAGPGAGIVASIRSQSLKVATLAKAIRIAETGSPAEGEEAFLAGILSDCGKLVFADNWPDEFLELSDEEDTESESVAFGADHARVGAYLLTTWGLPHEIVEAVAYHHQPSRSTSRKISALTAVHVAHALVTRADTDEPPMFDDQYMGEAQLDGHVEMWLGVAENIEYEQDNA